MTIFNSGDDGRFLETPLHCGDRSAPLTVPTIENF